MKLQVVTQYHYNPESYLKGFASKDGGLFRYSKKVESFQPENGGSYKSYGSKKNLYSESFEIEHMQKVDAGFCIALNHIKKYVDTGDMKAVSQQDFNSLVDFISSQPFRTPGSFDILQEANMAFSLNKNIDIKKQTREEMGTLIKQSAEKIMSKISSSRVAIYNSKSIPFLTSDNVVSLYRKDNNDFIGYTDAYLDPETHMIFPLTSELCLWAGGENQDKEFVEVRKGVLPNDKVELFNKFVFQQAAEYIYGKDKSAIKSSMKDIE